MYVCMCICTAKAPSITTKAGKTLSIACVKEPTLFIKALASDGFIVACKCVLQGQWVLGEIQGLGLWVLGLEGRCSSRVLQGFYSFSVFNCFWVLGCQGCVGFNDLGLRAFGFLGFQGLSARAEG